MVLTLVNGVLVPDGSVSPGGAAPGASGPAKAPQKLHCPKKQDNLGWFSCASLPWGKPSLAVQDCVNQMQRHAEAISAPGCRPCSTGPAKGQDCVHIVNGPSMSPAFCHVLPIGKGMSRALCQAHAQNFTEECKCPKVPPYVGRVRIGLSRTL